MSTVFQKTATDNCLILDSREGLTVPFDLGNWNEIRVGVELSYIATTGGGYNIAPLVDETQGGTSFTNSFFLGFRGTGTPFPDTVSGFYLGMIGNNTNPVTESANGAGADAAGGRVRVVSFGGLPMGCFYQGTFATQSFGNNSRCVGMAGAAASAATQYADQQGFRVRLTGQGTSGQFMQIDCFNNNNGSFAVATHVTPSVTGLRAFLSSMPNVVSGAYYPLTSGFVSPGGPLQFPNAFFIYSPFLTGSVRLHTLVIDRYA